MAEESTSAELPEVDHHEEISNDVFDALNNGVRLSAIEDAVEAGVEMFLDDNPGADL